MFAAVVAAIAVPLLLVQLLTPGIRGRTRPWAEVAWAARMLCVSCGPVPRVRRAVTQSSYGRGAYALAVAIRRSSP